MDTKTFETFFNTYLNPGNSITGGILLVSGFALGLFGSSFLRVALGLTAFTGFFWFSLRFSHWFGDYLYYVAILGGLAVALLAAKLIDAGLYLAGAACGYFAGSVCRDWIVSLVQGSSKYYSIIPAACSVLMVALVWFWQKRLLIAITSVSGAVLVYHGTLIIAVILSKSKNVSNESLVKLISICTFTILFVIFQRKRLRKKKQEKECE